MEERGRQEKGGSRGREWKGGGVKVKLCSKAVEEDGYPLRRRLHAFDLWRRVDVVLSFSD